MKKAARSLDFHACPASSGPTPHVGGPLLGPGEPTVKGEWRTLMRGTDRATCVGPFDLIVTGAATVKIAHKPAARVTDHMMHGGVLNEPLSPTISIGGPTTGVTVGNVAAGQEACQAAAATRASGKTKQTYGNCGLESLRQIINRDRAARGEPPVTESELLAEAVDNGLATRGQPNEGDSHEPGENRTGGGTYANTQQELLDRHGVGSRMLDQDSDTFMRDVAQATAEGRGVVTDHHPVGILWGTTSDGAHAVLVTGVEFGPDGEPRNVIVNDTGRNVGNCSRRYPADRFQKSLRHPVEGRSDELGDVTAGRALVTENPIW